MAYEPTLDDVLNEIYGAGPALTDEELAQYFPEQRVEAAPVEESAPQVDRGRGRVSTAANQNLSPTARALLDTIAGDESPDYRTIYGGKKVNDLSWHPNIAVPIQRGPNAGKTSSAAGRYQFLGSTWNDQAKKLGLRDFSPESQDLAAWNLAVETYGPNLEADLQSGDPAKIAQVGRALRKVWTSLPGGIEQGAHAGAFAGRFKQNLGAEGSTPIQSQQEATDSGLDLITLSDGSTINVERGMDLAEVAKHLKANGIDAEPMRQVALPDGSYVNAPYDFTDDQVLQGMRKAAPDLFSGQAQPESEKKGITPALISGAESAFGAAARGTGALIEKAGQRLESPWLQEKGRLAAEEGREWQQKAAERYQELTPEEAQQMGAWGMARQKFLEPLASGVGSIGATLPAFMIPGVGPAVGVGAIGAQEIGGELAEQERMGQTPDVMKTLGPAAVSTAVNVAGMRFFGPLKGLLGEFASPSAQAYIKDIVAKKGVEAASDAIGSRMSNILKETGLNVVGVGTGEVASRIAERVASDQPIDTPEALNEYADVFTASAPLGIVSGGLSGAGRYAAKKGTVEEAQIEQRQAELEAQRAAEAEQAQVVESEAAQRRIAEEAELERKAGIGAEVLPSEEPTITPPPAPVAPPVSALESQEPPAAPIAPVEELPAAPVPTDITAAPTAEVAPRGVQEELIPEPTVRQPEPKHWAEDMLGLPAKAGLVKKLKAAGLDIDNPADHQAITDIISKTTAKIEPQNYQRLEAYMDQVAPKPEITTPEVSSARAIQIPEPPNAGRSEQPEIRQEGGYPSISGEGVREVGQVDQAPARAGETSQIQVPEAKLPQPEAVEIPKAPEVQAAPAIEPKVPSAPTPSTIKPSEHIEVWDSLRTADQPDFASLSKPAQKLWRDEYKANEGMVGKDAVADIAKFDAGEKGVVAPKAVEALEVPKSPRVAEKPIKPKGELTSLQARAKFGKDIGAVVGAGGHYLRSRVNKKAAKAIEAGDAKGTISALKESKNPIVQWVAEKADLIDGLKVKSDEEAQETKLSKALFANEALRYRLGVLDALRDLRNKHAGIGEKGRIPYEETKAKIFKEEDFDPDGQFAGAEATSIQGALNTELRGRETVGSVKLKDLDEAISNIENDFTSSGRSEEEIRQVAGLIPRNIRAVGGAYDRGTNTVKLDPFYAQDEAVVAHELTHAVVSHAIDKPTPKQRPAVHGLKKLHEAVKDHESIKDEYGVTNIHEFVSEGLSNPDFQQKLSKIKYESTTAWGRFTDSIANILGLKKDNALMELIAISEQLAPTGRAKPEGKGEFPSLQKAPKEPTKPKQLVKETEPEERSVLRDGMKAAADVVKSGAWTRLETSLIDKNATLREKIKDKSTFDTNGKLRADLVGSANDQIFNIVTAGITEGFPVYSTDGTVMIRKDQKKNLSNITKTIDKLKIKNSRVFVSEIARALRGESILKEDAETVKRIDELRGKAKKLNEYAKTQSFKEGKAASELADKYDRQADKLQAKLGEEGREKLVTAEDIAEAKRRLAEHPEIQPILDDIHGLLKSLVDLWEEGGLINKEVAAKWKSDPYYIPLYASTEDLLRDPSKTVRMMGGGAKSLPNVKALKGGTQAINLLENLQRHYAFMTTAAAQNSTRKAAARDMELFGAARRTSPDDKQAIMFKENGKEIYYHIDDPVAFDAFQTAAPLMNPLLKAAREYTKTFRAVTLVNPLYWYRQLIRDPLHANVVSKTGIVTPIGATISFAKIIAGMSKEYGELKRRGVVGAVDSLSDPTRFKKISEKNPGLFKKGAEWVMHVHEAADAATRVEVYKAAIKEAKKKGMSREDAKNYATMRAREIINFANQGRSETLQAIRATVPFFSAALNSLDSVARAATGKGLNRREAAEARRLFTSRLMMIASFTTAYALAMQDDEDYINSPDSVNNWLTPTGKEDAPFVMNPIPFELGFFAKIMPEMMVRLNSGTLRPSEAKKMAKEAAWSTLTPPLPIPQLLKPLFEAATNTDFHTGQDIVRAGEARKVPTEQTRGASSLSIEIGRALGISPIQVEHFGRGYLTELWTVMGLVADKFLEEGKGKPEKYPGEVPIVMGGAKGILTKPERDRDVDTFYELQDSVSRMHDTVVGAQGRGDVKTMERLMSDAENEKKFYAAPAGRDIAEGMSKVQKAIDQINNSDMDPKQKQIAIREHRKWYNELASRGVKVLNSLGIE